ncbi:hypothetical protein D9M73_254390 [compost metagenome]
MFAASTNWPPVRSILAFSASPGTPGTSQSTLALSWNVGTPMAWLPSLLPLAVFFCSEVMRVPPAIRRKPWTGSPNRLNSRPLLTCSPSRTKTLFKV